MDALEILKIVKRKIFESRKKIIFDASGKRMFVDTWTGDKVHPQDVKLIEEGDGWNLADKDYVDFKVSELYKNIQYSSTPSAPQQEMKQTTVFISNGINTSTNTENVITFFNPGILLKKNWYIIDFTIICDVPVEDDLTLSLKNISDSKFIQLSKIKMSSKNLFVAESNYKVDNTKAVVFQLKSTKVSKYDFSLQITVGIN